MMKMTIPEKHGTPETLSNALHFDSRAVSTSK